LGFFSITDNQAILNFLTVYDKKILDRWTELSTLPNGVLSNIFYQKDGKVGPLLYFD